MKIRSVRAEFFHANSQADRQTDTYTHTHTHIHTEAEKRTDRHGAGNSSFLSFAKALISMYNLCDRRVIIPNKRPWNYTKQKKNKLGKENCAVQTATIVLKKKIC